MTTDPLFLSWCAGFFDGEGCVMIHRRRRTERFIEHYVTAVVGQKRKSPLVAMQEAFGGVLTKLTTSGCYQWRAHGGTAERFYVAIRPYLRLKGAEVDLALAIRKTVGSQSSRLPQGVWQQREDIWKAFRVLRDTPCIIS